MTVQVALAAISALLLIIQGLLAYMWHQRGLEIATLRAAVADLLTIVTANKQNLAVNAEKISQLDDQYDLLHQWKNVIYPQLADRQYANAVGLIERTEEGLDRRLELLERKVLNGSK